MEAEGSLMRLWKPSAGFELINFSLVREHILAATFLIIRGDLLIRGSAYSVSLLPGKIFLCSQFFVRPTDFALLKIVCILLH
jgi:hypothetical protein